MNRFQVEWEDSADPRDMRRARLWVAETLIKMGIEPSGVTLDRLQCDTEAQALLFSWRRSYRREMIADSLAKWALIVSISATYYSLYLRQLEWLLGHILG